MGKWAVFLWLFLLCLSNLQASPYTPTELAAPALFLKRATKKYEQIMNSSEMESGNLEKILKRPEFSNFSDKDKKAFGLALAAGNILKNISYKINGSHLIIDDQRLVLNSKVEIDFRELSDPSSNVIYINNKKYVFSLLRHGLDSG